MPGETDYRNMASEAKTEKADRAELSAFPSRGNNVTVRWDFPEFQSICPVSGRHDQGVVTIEYKVKEKILESKSVRDYLTSWRTKTCWQEYVTNEIADALFECCKPEWLNVEIEWTPRGGIYAVTTAERPD
ncbi:MAG: NADPH-dependent 7-cyano-7-deazaguanine reductase [Fibrobacterota bacterium]